MHIVSKLAAAAVVALLATSGGALANPVGAHGALAVSGNRIVDSAARPTRLSGMSFFWSNTGWGQERFYNAETVHGLAQHWGVSLVRAAVGAEGPGSFQHDRTANLARAEAVVDAAIAEGIYVIVDWHSHHAHMQTEDALAFFTHMAQKYGNTPNVIYEIYNEPLNDVTWAGHVKPYAQRVVDAIRAIDSDNLILVGSPTWSQDVDVAAADPLVGTNIAYTLHFYAGTHGAGLRAKAQRALDLGAALFVSEWGTVNANGDGGVAAEETQRWAEFMASNCLSHANWSVSDKLEGASIFTAGAPVAGPWADSHLTASGRYVRDMLANQPTICSPQ